MTDQIVEKQSDNGNTFDELKKEVADSHGQLRAKIDELAKANAAILESLSQRNIKSEQESVAEDLVFQNPKKYTEQVVASAVNKVREELGQRDKKQAELAGLVAEFPELGDISSPLAKKAVAIYEQLPPEEKAHSSAYRAAIYQAASDLEISPASKRKKKSSEDDFSFRGGEKSRVERQSDGELDPATVEFAERLNLNIRDKKVLAGLQEQAKHRFNGKWRPI